MRRFFSILLGGLLLSATFTASAAGDRTAGPPIISWQAPAFYKAPSSGRTALTDLSRPLPFVPVTPCRQYSTLLTTKLVDATPRTITLSGAPCGIPATAAAVAVNITIFNIAAGATGVFRVDTVSPPTVAWINYPATEIQRGNAGVVSTTSSPANIVVEINQGGGNLDFVVDVFGWYGFTSTSGGFALVNSAAGDFAVLGEELGANGIGVYGFTNGAAGVGVLGSNGTATGFGVEGNNPLGVGVQGNSTSSIGVKGISATSNAVWAETTGAWDALFATGGRHGVYSVSTAASGVTWGVFGYSASTTAGAAGVLGNASDGFPANWATNTLVSAGVTGVTKGLYGVVGVSNPAGLAGKFVSQNASTGTAFTLAELGYSSTDAAQFWGNVGINAAISGGALGDLHVTGTLSKGFGTFKIDHPLDPENKYLYHSFVESPDMMNIYNGIVELDALGEAIVQLPAYFEALNKDFRYQLTSIGRSQPDLYVADEIQNLQFRIAGGKPHAKASWQVTGVRQDPLANARRVIPEVEKEPEAKGYYLHPAVYKQSADKDLTRRLLEVQKAREIEKARKESSQ